MATQGSESDSTGMLRARWSAPLLLLTVTFFVFGFSSGFGLFFLRGFLPAEALLGRIHWIGAAAGLLPYLGYQYRHYGRVRRWRGTLHYRLGVCTLWSIVAMVVTGGPLIMLTPEGSAFPVIELAHIMSGFAFALLVTGHLVLVARIALQRVQARGQGSVNEEVERLA